MIVGVGEEAALMRAETKWFVDMIVDHLLTLNPADRWVFDDTYIDERVVPEVWRRRGLMPVGDWVRFAGGVLGCDVSIDDWSLTVVGSTGTTVRYS